MVLSITMVLATICPQGGWAHWESSGEDELWNKLLFLHHYVGVWEILGVIIRIIFSYRLRFCRPSLCRIFTISSGRMSSAHILGEDELWNNLLFLYYYHLYAFFREDNFTTSSGRMSSAHILGENEHENQIMFLFIITLCEYLPQYPQRGWAHYILTGIVLENCTLFSINNLISPRYPQGGKAHLQEGWAGELSFVLLQVHLDALHYWYGSKRGSEIGFSYFILLNKIPQSAMVCGFAEIVPQGGWNWNPYTMLSRGAMWWVHDVPLYKTSPPEYTP